MENLNAEQAIEILEKFDFFQGQRAGRELWKDKPFDVQEQDIANFSRDVALLKNYIKELTEENERLKNICESYMLQYGTVTDKEAFLKNERADTVRKMQERLIAEIENTPNANEFFITAWRTKIDQIAKDLLEGEISPYEGENDARINKWMNLVFEEAKIRAKREYDKRCVECIYNEADMFKLIAEAKSEAIIKMHSLIKERCIKGGIYPAFVASTIEKVAKELLGGD